MQTSEGEKSSSGGKITSSQQGGLNLNDVSLYIETLKRQYTERLEQYQLMVSDVCVELEGDEMISAIANDKEMDEFRVKRFQEIISESLKREQEAQINKLIEQNAMLHVGQRRVEEQKECLKNELNKITSHVAEFEGRIEQDAASQDMLQSEIDQMKKNGLIDRENYEKVLKIKEQSNQQKDQMYKSEIQDQQMELECLRHEKSEAILDNEQLRQQIEVLTNNIQILLLKLQSRSESDRQAGQHVEEFRNATLKFQGELSEIANVRDRLQEELQLRDSENHRLKQVLEEIQKENDYLSANIETLKIQATKVDSKVHERSQELTKKLEKVNGKKKALKAASIQQKEEGESQIKENEKMRRQIQDQKDEFERIIAMMKVDMLKIKTEWEKRCNQIEVASYAMVDENRTKQEATVTRIQGEYQRLLENRLAEIEKDERLTGQSSISKDRLDKDYILRSLHQQIIEEEIEALQRRYQETLQQISEKHSASMAAKIKEVSERKSKEYSILSESLQESCTELQSKLNESMRSVMKTKEQLSSLENDYLQVKEENNQAYEDLSEVQAELEINRERCQELTELSENLQAELEVERRTNGQLQTETDQREREIATINKQHQGKSRESEEARQKARELENECVDLSDKLQEAISEKQDLQKLLEISNAKTESEKASAIRTITFQETLKLEKAREEHEEERLTLAKRIRVLEKELAKLSEENEEALEEQKASMLKNNSAREKSENERRTAIEKFNNLSAIHEKHRGDTQRIIKRILLQLASVRGDLQELKEEVSSELVTLSTFVLHTFRGETQQLIARRRTDLLDLETKLVDQASQRMDQAEEVASQETFQLQETMQQLNQQLQQLQSQKESDQHHIQQLQQHNERLQSQMKKCSADMEEHNKILGSEIARIKEEASQIAELAVESASAKSKAETESLQKELTSSKIQEEMLVSELRAHVESLEEMKSALQQSIEEVNRRNETIERLNEELGGMQDIYEQMQDENNSAFEVLENKLDSYKQTIQAEATKYKIAKEDSNMQVLQLQEEMGMLRHHISLRTASNIDTLAKYDDISKFSKHINNQSTVSVGSTNSSLSQQRSRERLQPQSSLLSQSPRQVPPMTNIPRQMKVGSTGNFTRDTIGDKSYAKNITLEKSFDQTRLETLSEFSRMHKQKAMDQQQPHRTTADTREGQHQQRLRVQDSPSQILSHVPTQETQTSRWNSDQGLLFEIKHLIAQSYDLVNKGGDKEEVQRDGKKNQRTNDSESSQRTSTQAAIKTQPPRPPQKSTSELVVSVPSLHSHNRTRQEESVTNTTITASQETRSKPNRANSNEHNFKTIY